MRNARKYSDGMKGGEVGQETVNVRCNKEMETE